MTSQTMCTHTQKHKNRAEILKLVSVYIGIILNRLIIWPSEKWKYLKLDLAKNEGFWCFFVAPIVFLCGWLEWKWFQSIKPEVKTTLSGILRELHENPPLTVHINTPTLAIFLAWVEVLSLVGVLVWLARKKHWLTELLSDHWFSVAWFMEVFMWFLAVTGPKDDSIVESVGYFLTFPMSIVFAAIILYDVIETIRRWLYQKADVLKCRCEEFVRVVDGVRDVQTGDFDNPLMARRWVTVHRDVLPLWLLRAVAMFCHVSISKQQRLSLPTYIFEPIREGTEAPTEKANG